MIIEDKVSGSLSVSKSTNSDGSSSYAYEYISPSGMFQIKSSDYASEDEAVLEGKQCASEIEGRIKPSAP
jgi:hypothetical protein